MVSEQRLRIEGRVSPRLLTGASQIQDIYALWFKDARHISVQTDGCREPVVQPGRGIGSFFSGGVDSFYTLFKHLDAITHLVLIEGFDFKMVQSEEACREAKEKVARVATSLGKELLVVATNARRLFEPIVSWNDYHGAVLAGVGLSLQNLFETIYVAASFPYRRLHPWGSHPLLDPLWSTERTQMTHDGAELSRVEKIVNWVCHSELALQNLRVCWAPGAEYNCGHCEKCLRTMIMLYIGGALGKCPVLPPTFSLREVERQRYTTEFQIAIAQETIALLERKADPSPFDLHLKQALETAINRSRRKMAHGHRRRIRFTPGLLLEVIRRRLRSAPPAGPMGEAHRGT
jgi:hypothetical protein